MLTSKFKWMRLVTLFVAGLLVISPLAHVQTARAQTQAKTGIVCTDGPSFSLTANADYIMMPDMNTMWMWSYGLTGVGNEFQHPGPTLCVTEGQTVSVTLHNSLPYDLPTSIVFPGQENVKVNGVLAQPDLATGSLTNSVATNGDITYTFVATHPGTFIYESGTDTKTQVPMGLFGALIVRPAAAGATHVYNDAGYQLSTEFTAGEEFMALLSEVDPYQHAAWEKGLAQGRAFDLNNYNARYWLINGRGFPDSIADNYADWLPNQPYGALARIYPNDKYLWPNETALNPNPVHPLPSLERFINVGTEEYPFHPHGQNGSVIGRDGYPLAGDSGQDLSFEKFAVNIGPGQTWDVLFSWHDAEQYSESNPVPSLIPDGANITLGMFFSGSPYLGKQENLPPGGSTLNQCGEYYIISHNHALFQLDAFGQTMSGPITYLRVDPPQPNTCP